MCCERLYVYRNGSGTCVGTYEAAPLDYSRAKKARQQRQRLLCSTVYDLCCVREGVRARRARIVCMLCGFVANSHLYEHIYKNKFILKQLEKNTISSQKMLEDVRKLKMRPTFAESAAHCQTFKT